MCLPSGSGGWIPTTSAFSATYHRPPGNVNPTRRDLPRPPDLGNVANLGPWLGLAFDGELALGPRTPGRVEAFPVAGEANDIAPVGVHHEDLALSLPAGAEDDLPAVRRPVRVLVVPGVRGDLDGVRSVRVHHDHVEDAVVARRVADLVALRGPLRGVVVASLDRH